MTQRPIAEKYCEGKLKRMTKVKSKEPEIVRKEQNGRERRVCESRFACLTRGMEWERRKGGTGGVGDNVATACWKLLSLHEEKVGHRSSGGMVGKGVELQFIVA